MFNYFQVVDYKDPADTLGELPPYKIVRGSRVSDSLGLFRIRILGVPLTVYHVVKCTQSWGYEMRRQVIMITFPLFHSAKPGGVEL